MTTARRDHGVRGEAAEALCLAAALAERSLVPPLSAFAAAIPPRPPARVLPPRPLPVLRWVEALPARSAPETHQLTAALAAAAQRLAWGQTYRAEDISAAFLERYGWCELLGRRGHFACEELALGVLLLGPETVYPLHRHEAEEVYIVLSGKAFWLKGCAETENALPPGSVVHHPPWTPHALRTVAEPLLALYLWRGGDLTQKSHLS